MVKIIDVGMSVADYCAAFDRNEVQIDRAYQRSPNLWTGAAQSYLVETILKEFPIPKLALHQKTDLRSKQTIKFVIDGQQRSLAIRAFFKNELRLSRNIELREAAGKTYDQLSGDLQESFLAYSLRFDQFEAAGEEDVREYFRRINSFTAPLNAEEVRHARFQGPMKWFVHSLAERYGETLVGLGVLPKSSVLRMADTKFLAELVHAMLTGIHTTNRRMLDQMYKERDKGEDLEGADSLSRALTESLSTVLEWPQLHETSLVTKGFMFYSLLLAVMHAKLGWEALKYIDPETSNCAMTGAAPANLLRLAAAHDEPETFDQYDEFIKASADKTNVKVQRETRVRWLARALTQATV